MLTWPLKVTDYTPYFQAFYAPRVITRALVVQLEAEARSVEDAQTKGAPYPGVVVHLRVVAAQFEVLPATLSVV